ncbi:MAG TPA: CsgG/HfaB family protein, partial [Nitrospiraceae bacterium]|nr:CsgG/HfaB family protein [Nitrospiraceae bacterium]
IQRCGLPCALPVAAMLVFWGCAGGQARVNPLDSYWYGTPNSAKSVDPRADYSQVEQQLATLTSQLTASFPTSRVRRIAVLSFENTASRQTDPLGAYLTEKITHLLYANRPATVVERTFLHKVLDEIERGYSGRFDDLSLKEAGHLLNADTLILGSYTMLANGITEIMARAVVVETGEIVGVSSTTILSSLIPNVPVPERQPLLASKESVPPGVETGRRFQEVQGGGTFNIVPSPPSVASYSTPQSSSTYPAYPTYPTPQIVVPFYYAPAWSPIYPSYPAPFLSRPLLQPRFLFKHGGNRGRRR